MSYTLTWYAQKIELDPLLFFFLAMPRAQAYYSFMLWVPTSIKERKITMRNSALTICKH